MSVESSSQPRSKPDWRRWAQVRREALDLSSLSAQICHQISKSPIFCNAHQIFIYMPLRSEIDLRSLGAQYPDKTWGIPRCLPEVQLAWHQWCPTDLSALCRGVFGLREPTADSPRLDPAQVELILVPGLAFDVWGGRLGYGKGYYDRFLSGYPQVQALGICAHDCFLSTRLPCDPWDVPMGAVVTERGLFPAQPDPKAG